MFVLIVGEYIYRKERKLWVDQLIKSKNIISLSCLSWRSVLVLSGARFPATGDTLEYPSGTDLEIFRQGLLTFNTYVSALQVSPLFTPSLSSFQTPSTNHQTGYRVFFLGQVSLFHIFSFILVDRCFGYC